MRAQVTVPERDWVLYRAHQRSGLTFDKGFDGVPGVVRVA